ncbi:sugar phosphate isomerase/epimerase family protein [Desertihabitans aurantiacus]|uniref:sugar phosphate isomerase/epimerase family protein n=1 Tax=Desertihabitans aurantiacus TaxID=2282477 RepID=UPI000DF7EC75|nr:sugar phosphate isomerase/epimerase [Desertihabitans aurantiacus]
MFSPRLGISSISFRHRPLPQALRTIADAGFEEIDLGALPGVCDHVPFVLDETAVEDVRRQVAGSGLRVRSVNGDVGDLNAVLDAGQRDARRQHLARLLRLTAAVGARALVLPCGALSHEPVRDLDADLDLVAVELAGAAERAAEAGVELWTEALHVLRLCCTLQRATRLTDRLAGTDVGIVLDLSHVVASGADPVEAVRAFGGRIAHVHLRDAVPGDIHLSIGRGAVDFAAALAALDRAGYTGHLSLELETRDVTEEQRPAAAVAAGRAITTLLQPS